MTESQLEEACRLIREARWPVIYAGGGVVSADCRDLLMQLAEQTDRRMEFLGTVALLIVGGNDTTLNSITGSVLALNENPGE